MPFGSSAFGLETAACRMSQPAAVQPLPAQSTANPVARACLPVAATAFLVAVALLHCSASFRVATIHTGAAAVTVAGVRQHDPAAWCAAASCHAPLA